MAEITQGVLSTAGIESELGEQRTRRAELEKQSATMSEQTRGIYDSMARIQEQKANATAPVRAKMIEKVQTTPSTEVQLEPIPDFKRPTLEPAQMQESFGMLMAASLLTGLASRQPFYGVMNAMTGALTGFMRQDEKMAAEAMQVFDKNLTVIKERNQQKREAVDRALKQHGNDLQALKMEFELIGSQFDDPMALATARSKSIQEAQKVLEQNIRSIDQTIERLYRDKASVEANIARIAEAKERRIAEQARASEAASYRGAMLDLARRREDRQRDESLARMERWKEDARLKAEKIAGGNNFSAQERKDIAGRNVVLNMMDDLIDRQRSAIASGSGYGGYLLDKAGNVMIQAKRAMGAEGSQNEINFFSDLETVSQPDRHATFGATLTGNEKEAYRSGWVGAGDDPKVLLSVLENKRNTYQKMLDSKLDAYRTKIPSVKAAITPSQPAGGAARSTRGTTPGGASYTIE